MYRSVLIKLPFLHSLGMDAVQMRSLNRQMALTDLKLGENLRDQFIEVTVFTTLGRVLFKEKSQLIEINENLKNQKKLKMN